MPSAAQTEDLFHSILSAAFSALGFSPAEGPAWETADASWWFERRAGKVSEAIWCRLNWRPSAILNVQLLASKHTLENLRQRGLETRAAGHNLHQFQVYFMDAKPSRILPQMIPLPKASDPSWPAYAGEIADRVANEIRSVDPQIWSDLRSAL